MVSFLASSVLLLLFLDLGVLPPNLLLWFLASALFVGAAIFGLAAFFTS